MANSTRSALPGLVATLASDCPGARTCSSSVSELDLAPRAARLDVGQDFLQVADAICERLHLAQAAVYLLEPLADGAEGLAEARLERGLQPLVHRGAHLVELRGVVRLECRQPFLHRLAQRLHAALGRLRPGSELRGEGLQAPVEPGLAGLDGGKPRLHRGEVDAGRPQPQRHEQRQHGDQKRDDDDDEGLDHGEASSRRRRAASSGC